MFNGLKSFKSVSFVSAGTMLNALMGFVFLTGVAKHLDLELFGKYALLTSLLTLISRLLDFGTNSLFVASNRSNRNFESGFLAVKMVLIAVAIPTSLVALNLLKLNSTEIVLIFIAGLIAYGINYYLYAYYQRDQRYFEIVLLNSLPSMVKVIFGVLLYLNYVDLNLVQCFAVFSLSIFVSILVNVFYPIHFWRTELNFNAAKEYIKLALSPGISQLIFESWQTVNNLITKFFNSFSDVGLFSMANKISNIFSLISYSVFTVLLPKNTARNQKNKSYDFKESAVLTLAVLIMSVFATFAAQLFIHKAFGNKFDESIKYLGLLIFASALTAIQNFMENYFYVRAITQYLVRINILKLALLVGLALWLIPSYGLYSLAVANFAAAVFGISVVFGFIYRLEQLD